MSDYTDNIKRIVGIDELKDKLKALEEKAAIDGRRGIAYEVGEGTGKTQSAGGDLVRTGLNSAAAAATKAALQAMATSANTEGKNSATGDASNAAKDGQNSGSGSINSAEDGVYDAEDYFDTPGLGSLEDNAILAGLTGFRNLSDTKDVSVRFDGMYVPPEGYQSIDSNLYYELWFSGYNWDGSGSIPGSPPPFPAVEQGFEAYLAYYNSDAVQALTGQRREYNGGYTLGAGTPPAFYQRTVDVYTIATEAFVGSTTASLSRSPCTPGADNCPTSAPASYYFPLSDSMQLAQNKYVGDSLIPSAVGFSTHPRDPNTPPDLAGEQSTIELTFASGTRNALIEANNIGGSTISEIDPITKDYIGASRVYNGSGMLSAYAVDSTERANYAP